MKIYKTRAFVRLNVAVDVKDSDLISAIREISAGLWDARIGGQIYKKRIPFRGQGKRGGVRTLVVFSRNKRAFFIYVFAKSRRANISISELVALKKLAKELLQLENKQLDQAVRSGALIEVNKIENE